MYRICLRKMFKYSATLNCLLETVLFPAAIILRIFLSLLAPVYKILLYIQPQCNFSLVPHFWSHAVESLVSMFYNQNASSYNSAFIQNSNLKISEFA